VPKVSNFKLKNKKDCQHPNQLDTINVYKMILMYNGVELIYPNINMTSSEESSFIKEINESLKFIRFFSKGRCLAFSIPSKDYFGNQNQLREKDLNPNNTNYSKNYYCSDSTGRNIEIESFVYGDGYGRYIRINYTLNTTGDTLFFVSPYTKIIYVKEYIPSNWKRNIVNW
jgi:hypothetical protein